MSNEVSKVKAVFEPQDEFSYNPKFGGGDNDVYLKFNDWTEDEQTYKIRIVSPTYTKLEFRKGEELLDSKLWDIDDVKKAIADPDIKKSQRFSWVVLVRQDDADPIAKVYEASAGVWKKIAAIAQDVDWQPISETDLKITRTGIKKDARYNVVPSPTNRGPITDNEWSIADEVQITKYLPQAMPLKKFREIFGD